MKKYEHIFHSVGLTFPGRKLFSLFLVATHLSQQSFCLFILDHHKQKQLEKDKQQEQQLQDPDGQVLMATSTLSRHGLGLRPRFTSNRVQTPQRQVSSARGSNVRHEPYPGIRPRKPSNSYVQNHKHDSQSSSSLTLPTNPASDQRNTENQVIKLEPVDNNENAENSFSSSDANRSGSPSLTPMCQNSTDISESPIMPLQGNNSESSSSAVVHESANTKYTDSGTIPSDGLNLNSDLSKFTGIIDSSVSDSVSDNVSVKVEAVTESELDLEITGVTQPDFGIMPNMQGMVLDQSALGGAQGDVAQQGYSKSFLNVTILCPVFIPCYCTCLQQSFLQLSCNFH